MRVTRWPALAAFAVLVALDAVVGAGMLLYLAPPAAAQTTVDYDLDNDGLIDVDSLDQLNAIRWDLDGNGDPAAANASDYAAAFPNRITATGTRMGCPSGACAGYELTADLNFDADGNGVVTSTDPYPNWTSIGGDYNSTFDGDGYTISNLLMNNSDSQAGLLRGLASGRVIRNVGLIDADVTAGNGLSGVGTLVGSNRGTVETSYAQGGSVTVTNTGSVDLLGGLVGYNLGGAIRASYATAQVSKNGESVRNGGLVGQQSSGAHRQA